MKALKRNKEKYKREKRIWLKLKERTWRQSKQSVSNKDRNMKAKRRKVIKNKETENRKEMLQRDVNERKKNEWHARKKKAGKKNYSGREIKKDIRMKDI